MGRPKFTLRIEGSMHQKLEYTASFNGRSKNKEIETAIKRYIRDFENLHGTIQTTSDLDED